MRVRKRSSSFSPRGIPTLCAALASSLSRTRRNLESTTGDLFLSPPPFSPFLTRISTLIRKFMDKVGLPMHLSPQFLEIDSDFYSSKLFFMKQKKKGGVDLELYCQLPGSPKMQDCQIRSFLTSTSKFSNCRLFSVSQNCSWLLPGRLGRCHSAATTGKIR